MCACGVNFFMLTLSCFRSDAHFFFCCIECTIRQAEGAPPDLMKN